jgi:hypothetical protein
MTGDEIQKLKALFVATSLYYGHEIPDPALQLFVEDLRDLPFAAVARAIGEIRRDPKTTRCPLPAVIRARINPESDPESEAVMITGRILSAISRIGPYRAGEARSAIGEIGWQIVEAQGGWENICQIENDDIGTHRAQWKNHAKALISMNPNRKEAPELPSPPDQDPPRLIDIQKVFKSFPGGKV